MIHRRTVPLLADLLLFLDKRVAASIIIYDYVLYKDDIFGKEFLI